MKINRSVEQGLYVLLMLALQLDHAPLKSSEISQRLEVSDSYLKKILRKLVINGLIDSNASKNGGFTLARSIDTISLLDVCHAVDSTDELQIPALTLAAHLFPGSPSHINHSTQVGTEAFSKAQAAFNAELAAVPLSTLLETDSYQFGVVDWRK